MCPGSRSPQSLKIIAFSSTDTSYWFVLRHCSIFPTLPALWAEDRRKLSCVSEMFARKLANLTKIILKTLRSVDLRPPSICFREALEEVPFDVGTKRTKGWNVFSPSLLFHIFPLEIVPMCNLWIPEADEASIKGSSRPIWSSYSVFRWSKRLIYIKMTLEVIYWTVLCDDARK